MGEDGFYLAFPDGEDGVAEGLEGGEVAGVALFVGCEFGLPEDAVDGEVRVVYIHRFCRGAVVSMRVYIHRDWGKARAGMSLLP